MEGSVRVQVEVRERKRREEKDGEIEEVISTFIRCLQIKKNTVSRIS